MTLSELEELLKEESQEFIRGHIDDDPDLLALKFSRRTSLPVRAIAEEIRCIKKARGKLPGLSKYGLIYERTSLEQASSEFTAGYKAGLFRGDKLIDLTGGLGIDDIFFSKNFGKVFYCEQKSLLSGIFRHNIELLGINNISVHEGDSIQILKSFPDNYFDLIYADPARRDENRRFVGLKSCSPDVVELMPLLLNKSDNILIKASPAIEFEEVKRQFRNLKEFTVVSVDNECKEVLLSLGRDNVPDNKIIIKSVILNSASGVQRTFTGQNVPADKRKAAPEVLPFFYEPDGSIIKSRLTAEVAEEFSLQYINRSVDFLTSNELSSNFPGRIFEVLRVMPYKPGEIKPYLLKNGITRANVSRRDFPDPPEKIKKLLGLKDGGEDYLFFTKDASGKPVAIFCRKHKSIIGE